MKKIAVIGAGSWGTALASVCADNRHQVTLWVRDSRMVDEINTHHTNRKYLPDVTLAPSIRANSDLKAVVCEADAVLLVLPSHAMRQVVRQLAPFLPQHVLLIHATKGLELDTLKRMSQVIREEVPKSAGERLVVLTGPSHAEEVVRRSPTTVVVASECAASGKQAQELLNNSYFRVYTNPDLVGAEIAGALKNVIALGAGLSDGLGFGDNAKAALITRGLTEISRLGVKLGANPLTFSGLAGVGDLVVTCTSRHSRNWRAGYMLGQGHKLEDVLDQMGMVVEGVRTTKAAMALSKREEVRMPITWLLYKILFEGTSPRCGVEELMGRDATMEMEDLAPNQ
ncbi:MAG: NAD(P)H-dependent glycerol-3-phosphate dehydrogenase [Brevibacillus sp.]|nr:NAD(P)H-dependent glycerol-3-phosphate dehydrogenase [Brevibacillus sp.]